MAAKKSSRSPRTGRAGKGKAGKGRKTARTGKTVKAKKAEKAQKTQKTSKATKTTRARKVFSPRLTSRKKVVRSPRRVSSSAARSIKTITTIKDMRRYLREQRTRSRRVALVPTMGYLHEGHLSLVREARRLAHIVVASVFVNPLQFGPAEDLDRYPRDLAGDRRKLRAAGATVLFAPATSEFYPEGFQTYVEVTGVTRDFCGASRPGHFRGVATVVCKLFNIIQPDLAVFGQKDYQQLVTIRRLVRDLDLDVDIVGMPTVREEDGLAMSSRNSYLSPSQRQQATAIFRGLRKAKRELDNGERDAAELAACVLDLLREERDLEVEYVAVVDPETLERIPEVEDEAVVLVAARVGETRLIDNIRLKVPRRRRR